MTDELVSPPKNWRLDASAEPWRAYLHAHREALEGAMGAAANACMAARARAPLQRFAFELAARAPRAPPGLCEAREDASSTDGSAAWVEEALALACDGAEVVAVPPTDTPCVELGRRMTALPSSTAELSAFS